MRKAPTYAESVQQGVVGDDPLGLAPTNERLYNAVFPGFNNYVRYIRVYSAICWMTAQVTEAFEKRKPANEKAARQLYERAIEKIELALGWVNQGRALALAGSTRQFPNNERPLELAFATFGTGRATLFDAPTYQPSLTSGLGFLEARLAGTYGCLPAGTALAEAFDSAARELPGYRWLKSPEAVKTKRSQVFGLLPALDVTRPSRAEQDAFLARFYPRAPEDDAGDDDHTRWTSLGLTLRAVEAVSLANAAENDEPNADVGEIRACMARAMSEHGQPFSMGPEDRVQAWWAVLQVRQLQRLCLETLYCAVEHWIQRQESTGATQALEDCIGQLSNAGRPYLADELATVGDLERFFVEMQGGNPSLYVAAARWSPDQEDENEADVFARINALHAAPISLDEEGSSAAVADAFIGLAFCAVETRNLQANGEALRAMKADGDSCSLLQLLAATTRFREASVETFLMYLLRDWVVLRHFAVVAVRSVAFDGKNRFRFVLGDYGLERFDKGLALPRPALAADKLEHALFLCEQSGLLASNEGRYSLTARGRRQLSRHGAVASVA